jgi:hypothetical protein
VKVNCVDAGVVFFVACCKMLMFSCPRDGVMGNFSALAVAIDSEIIPVLSSWKC